MNTKEYIKFLEKEIHTTIIATVDEKGLPVTCAIDIMYSDEKALYFLTAKGKGFYHRLIKEKFIALTGIKGEDTMHCVAVSVRGKVEELGGELLPFLFSKNPYMAEIYPTEKSREALTVFRFYEASGEWFDLSKKPIERDTFYIGKEESYEKKYFITDKCVGCKVCQGVCPQNCIDFTSIPAEIHQKNCLHCGNCMEVCPNKAVVWG